MKHLREGCLSCCGERVANEGVLPGRKVVRERSVSTPLLLITETDEYIENVFLATIKQSNVGRVPVIHLDLHYRY